MTGLLAADPPEGLYVDGTTNRNQPGYNRASEKCSQLLVCREFLEDGAIGAPASKFTLAIELGSASNAHTIGEGHAVLIFVDLKLDPDARPPTNR